MEKRHVKQWEARPKNERRVFPNQSTNTVGFISYGGGLVEKKKGFTTRRFVKNLPGTRADLSVRQFHFPLLSSSFQGRILLDY